MRDRSLTLLSLGISAAAFAYAAWVHQQADQAATEALRKREVEFVARYTAKVQAVVEDVTGRTNALPNSPQTLEELLTPLLMLIGQAEQPSPERVP